MTIKVNPQTVEYKGATIVQWPDGIDIVDNETGKWRTAKSMHSAKWNISVWTRLKREFVSMPLSAAS